MRRLQQTPTADASRSVASRGRARGRDARRLGLARFVRWTHGHRVTLSLLLALLAAAATARPASAGPAGLGTYKFPVDGKVRGVRAADVDGDGRKDLVVLVERRLDGVAQQEVWVLPTPATP